MAGAASAGTSRPPPSGYNPQLDDSGNTVVLPGVELEYGNAEENKQPFRYILPGAKMTIQEAESYFYRQLVPWPELLMLSEIRSVWIESLSVSIDPNARLVDLSSYVSSYAISLGYCGHHQCTLSWSMQLPSPPMDTSSLGCYWVEPPEIPIPKDFPWFRAMRAPFTLKSEIRIEVEGPVKSGREALPRSSRFAL